MIVRLTIALLACFCCFSCNKIGADEQLLNIIIKESNFSIKDSIFFDKKSTNKKAVTFFERRKSKNMAFKHIYKEEYNNKIHDSVYREIDSVLHIELPIKRNNYIMNGKGISEIAEIFLKDSFNYKDVAIKNWNLNNNMETVFVKEKIQHGRSINISKPVYNLTKDKAIVYKKLGGNYLETTLYFF